MSAGIKKGYSGERLQIMKIVIIGVGKVGKKIAEQLTAEGHDIIVVDSAAARLNTLLNAQDVMCVQGNGAFYEVQMEAEVNRADVMIAVTPHDEVNMLCCLLAKKLGAKRCIARVRTPGYYRQLGFIKEELALSMTVNPEFAAASEITRVLILPAAAQVEVFAGGRVELVEFRVSENNPIVGSTLAETYKKSKIKILVCAVQRNGEVIIPDGGFIPQVGDRMSIVSNHEGAEQFFKRIGNKHGKIKSVMIVGGGRIGYYLAKQLVSLGMEVKIIENDYKRCLELSETLSEASVIHADGTDHIVLKEEGIEHIDAFVALTGIDEENMVMAMYAKTKNVQKVIAKINRGSYMSISDNIGLDSIVSPKQLAANNILGYIRAMKNSEKSNNIETIYKVVDEKVEAMEFIVRENAPYVNKPLRELNTKKDVLIASIVRNRRPIVPGGDDYISIGDSVIVVTTAKNLHDLREVFL